MPRKAAFLLAFLLIVAASPSFAAKPKKEKVKPLGARIEAIVNQPDAARGFWGIEVVSLTTGKELYALNADKLFTPASNTKLFTTSAAMALIGPDYRYKTTLETTGSLDKYGRLSGDLALVGHGDTNLSGRTLPYNLRTERKLPPIKVLEDLADQLVQKGVKFIDGDIVGDDSFYAFERYGEGWTQDDLVWEWGAPVSALTINDNVVFCSIMPGEHAGEKAFISITPFADYYRIDNRILTTPSGSEPRKIYISREPGSSQVTFWGNIPVDDPGAHEALAIEDPASYAAQLFRQLLEERGVVIYGHARARHTELAKLQTISVTTVASAAGGGGDHVPNSALPQSTLLATYESQPLAQDIRVINKISQNLHAEMTLRLLGHEKGSAGTIESGLEVVRGFLTQAGIQGDEYVFFDGSGLSRQNLVTPHAIVKLLSYIHDQPWGAQFQDSLPVAGVDGSLSDRFKNSPAAGKVSAKTGSLGHVNALSGFARTNSGDLVCFSIIANNHTMRGKRALDAIDNVVEQIVTDVPAK